MTQFKILIGLFVITLTFITQNSFSQDLSLPVGKWKTIDDETKKPKSIVEISLTEKGKLTGKITQLFREPNEDQNPLCDKCQGETFNKPVLGLTILWDLTKDSDNKWDDGQIMDPKNGKVYKCKMTLIEDGKKLQVRGFIGFSLLGRTQTWERL